ncbi:hypothetical protein KUCAC02_017684, partial [Chaenocephalus aceratus]
PREGGIRGTLAEFIKSLSHTALGPSRSSESTGRQPLPTSVGVPSTVLALILQHQQSTTGRHTSCLIRSYRSASQGE